MGRVLPGYLSKWTTENVAKGKIHTTNIKKLFPVVLKYPVRLV